MPETREVGSRESEESMLERTKEDDSATKRTSVPRTEGRSARTKHYKEKRQCQKRTTEPGKEENSAKRKKSC